MTHFVQQPEAWFVVIPHASLSRDDWDVYPWYSHCGDLAVYAAQFGELVADFATQAAANEFAEQQYDLLNEDNSEL